MTKLVVVAGPTASGKSALARALARKFNGAIVSADSMQIYRGLDIGTAKEALSERQGLDYFMVDLIPPEGEFSAAEYAVKASEAVSDITKAGKLAVVAGGTGLYIDALLYPLNFSEAPKNAEIRLKLEAEARDEGLDCLYERLKAVDSASAEKISPSDKKRIIRALEIYLATGRPKSEQKDERKPRYDYLMLGKSMERPVLYERINQRVDAMFETGLMSEVNALRERYGNKLFDFQSMQAIGYKEFKHYFEGTFSLAELKELIKKNTRNYAKRQLTWFNKTDINWVADEKEAFKLTEEFLRK
ncbi:MAG TPA: tRNA (adenosine(37)-N6)-dimethylallyltransferase MiaA [Eubacteriales bacterium]|jgi:tRNA dimethylallyltransferase|nr:tRNA (adenosine(37)-N6)-dimethylallyltransferase MiaA [Clostridia bacterium]HRR89462.1 tRNA (adenosine(37)-N6)-dimethylallyltransferase MiaA [Eubacteriales bacterium]HRU84660.1 tRNA (adenosine(37)-N6)-dimethylallyltransferase MiaA [Eubacteriales bacterium]